MTEPLSLPVFRKISRIVDGMGLRAYVIGGYVRDYYLCRPCTDIDVVVVGSGIDVAEALARETGSNVTVFKTLGKAVLPVRKEWRWSSSVPERSPIRGIPANRSWRRVPCATTNCGVTLPSMRWPGRSTAIRSESWKTRSAAWKICVSTSSGLPAIPTSPSPTTRCG